MNADGPAYTYTLSDDRHRVTLRPRTGATITMGFPEPLSDERLKETLKALEKDFLGTTYPDKIRPGQSNSYWRYVTRFGDFYPSIHLGPPTWWLPRAGFEVGRDVSRKPQGLRSDIHRIEIRFGWWRAAFALAWRSTK